MNPLFAAISYSADATVYLRFEPALPAPPDPYLYEFHTRRPVLRPQQARGFTLGERVRKLRVVEMEF